MVAIKARCLAARSTKARWERLCHMRDIKVSDRGQTLSNGARAVHKRRTVKQDDDLLTD